MILVVLLIKYLNFGAQTTISFGTMKLLIIGTNDQVTECREKFGSANSIASIERVQGATEQLFSSSDVVFDFASPRYPEQLKNYPSAMNGAVFLDTSLVRLSSLLAQAPQLRHSAFGFCGLRTLVDRELLEVTVSAKTDRDRLDAVCQRLGTAYQVVSDQAGMVTPRVICMIVNEAYFTLEEGTASREDIDLAMKLGTNYPYGPFEWANRIGLSNVAKVLRAAEQDSGDERYRVCPLLDREAGL